MIGDNYAEDQRAREIAREIARAVVTELLLAAGADISNPKELQALQADFQFIRSWRLSANAVKAKSLSAAVFFIVTSFLGYLAYAFKGHLQ